MKQFFFKMKYVTLGVVIGILFLNGVSYAADTIYNVQQFNVKILYNNIVQPGSDKANMFNNNGNYVPLAFKYAGTTYVPIRYVSNLFDIPIQYYPLPDRIFIGQIPDGKFMSPTMKPYYIKDLTLEYRPVTIAKTTYDTGYKMHTTTGTGRISFDLQNKYSLIKGYIGLDSGSKSDSNLNIYCNGKIVNTLTMFRIDHAKEVVIDVKDVSKLEFEIESPNEYFYKDITVDLADLLIK